MKKMTFKLFLAFGVIILLMFSFTSYKTTSLDEELKTSLTEYLYFKNADIYMLETSFAIRLDRIKTGDQPLHVKFDSDKYYYSTYNERTGTITHYGLFRIEDIVNVILE